MERPLNHTSKFVPKMFKAFTLYIFMTLAIFFGYIQIFGNVSVTPPTTPPGEADADTDSYFGQFVSNVMNFQNIDTDFNLSYLSADGEIDLSLQGNVVFDGASQEISLDLDLTFNQQNFDVGVVFASSNLYLTLNESTYKFNVSSSGDFDVSAILDFVMENVDIDLDKILDDLSAFLEMDIRNFDLNTFMSDMLGIEEYAIYADETKEEIVGYDFRFTIGKKDNKEETGASQISAPKISAQMICDKDFNISSVKMHEIKVQDNVINFSADVNKMNSLDVSVDYVENGEEISMAGITDYVGFAKNLFNNNEYVSAQVSISVDGEEYFATIDVDSADGIKIRLNTNFEGLDITLTYAENIIYIDANGLKLSFDIDDYAVWEAKINAIVEKYTSKSVADFVKELIEKCLSVDVDNVKWEEEILTVIGSAFGSADELTDYLPNATKMEENSFEMIWNNGLNVKLNKMETELSKVVVSYDKVLVDVDFTVVQNGVSLDGTYYDLTNLLPLADIVDSVMETSGFAGNVEFDYAGNKISATYTVNFEDEILAKLSTTLFGETFEVYLNGNKLIVKLGDIVIEGDIDEIDLYVEKIEQIFGISIEEKVESANQEELGVKEIISTIAGHLNDLQISAEDGKLAVVEYLANVGKMSVEGNVATIQFVNGNISVEATVSSSNETIVLPDATDYVGKTLEMVEAVKGYIEGKKYAGSFVIEYEDIELAGDIKLDLNNKYFEITGLTVGQNTLNLRYENNVAYVDYAGRKLKVRIDNVKVLTGIIEHIINANKTEVSVEEVQAEELTDIQKLLIKIFGQDVSTMAIEDLLKLVEIDIAGSLDDLTITGKLKTETQLGAVLDIEFADNMLSSINAVIDEVLTVGLTIDEYVNPTAIDETAYYDLNSVSEGSITLTYKDVSFVFDTIVDLSDKIFVNLTGSVLGENIEITILNNMLYISVGEIVVSTNFNSAVELYEYLTEAFSIVLPEMDAVDIKEMLSKINLNSVNGASPVNGLTYSVSGEGLAIGYTTNDMTLSVVLTCGHEVLNEITVPTTSEDLKTVITKAKNIKEYIAKGIFEFEFSASYNTLPISGKFKYYNGNFEIVDMVIMGENVSIRMQNNVIYFAYGNMKLKYDVSTLIYSTGNATSVNWKEILNKITSDALGVIIDFGIFGDVVNMLKSYSLKDYIDNLIIDLNGNTNAVNLTLYQKKEISNSQIMNALISFSDDKLASISLNVYDVLKNITLTVMHSDNSTMTEFVEEDYTDYTTDFVEGMLDSLKVEEDVYAFSSDISIRYSNNTFYGQLTAMLVKDETYTGFANPYKPMVSLATTSLGLNSYIYLIGEQIYIDINGFQITANLSTTTIDNVLDFVKNKFGITLDSQNETVQTAVEAFTVILPAIDQIYATWVEDANGITVNVNDDLRYAENSRFYDIVLQALIRNYENVIIPTRLVLGANIQDPNTTLYEDYSNYWLKEGDIVIEGDITKNLNFATYLTNITVGNKITDLSNVFVGETYKEITAVKSNYQTTNLSDFNDYSKVLDLVGSVYDYAMGYEYGLTINGSVVSEDSTITVDNSMLNIKLVEKETSTDSTSFLDKFAMKLEGALKFSVDSEQTYMIDLLYNAISSNAIYLTYAVAENNKIMAKLADSNLGDILALLSKIMNTDSSQVDDGISEVDKILSSTTEMIKVLKLIRLYDVQNEQGQNETRLDISVDLEGNGKVGTISLIFVELEDKLTLTQVKIANLQMSGFTINLTIDFDNSQMFNYFEKNDITKHIDFSGSSGLIKALVNTLDLSYFEIAGNLDIKITLPVLGTITMSVPVNFKIRILEDGSPEAMITIGVIPVITGVNNQGIGGYVSQNRMVYIYYKDEVLYIHRQENLVGKGNFEKKVKVHYSKFLEDPLYYLQYTIGFTNDIIGAIQESLDKSKGHTPNLGNVVNYFKVNGETSYEFQLDMEEISNDPNLDTITVGLHVINNEQTGSKNYVGAINFNMHMQFTDSISMDLDTSGDNILQLVNIGKNLDSDFISMTNYLASVANDPEGSEYEKSKDNDWELSSEVKYTLSYNVNNSVCTETFPSVTQAPASAIVLPTPKNIVIDDGMKKTTYTFVGWYETEECKKGTEYTQNVMPRLDTTLYAKWEMKELYYRTITFETNSNQELDRIRQLEGTDITLPTLQSIVTDNGKVKTTRTFAGWYTTESIDAGTQFTNGTMPKQNTILYAKWVETYEYYRTVSFDTDCDVEIESVKALEGTTFTLPSLETYSVDDGEVITTRVFAGWYTSENFEENTLMAEGVIPTTNTTLYAKWNETYEYYRTVSFDTDCDVELESVKALEGATFELPSLETYSVDDGEVITTRVFAGWYASANFEESTLMTEGLIPTTNTTLYAKWNETYQYYRTVSFDTDCDVEIESVKALEGTNFELPSLETYTTEDDEKITTRVFAGWYTSENFEENTLMTEGVIPTADTTLYAKWNETYEYYRTVTFVTNSTESVNVVKGLTGDTFNLPVLIDKQVTADNVTDFYKFGGWFTTSNFADGTMVETGVVGEQNSTLYAYWILEKTEITRQLYVYFNGEFAFTTAIKVGENIDLSRLTEINETTKYYTDADYQEEYAGEFVMENEDLSLYVRNAYNLTVVSAYGTVVNVTELIYQGEDISTYIPVQSSYVDDDKTTNRTVYTFQGYENITDIMPGSNLTIEAIWDVDSRDYYTLTIISEYGKDNYTRNETFIILEGTVLSEITTFPTLESYVEDDQTTTRTVYTFGGYENIAEVMPSANLTIKAKWDVDSKDYHTLTVISEYGKDNYTRNETVIILEGTDLADITTFPMLESYVVDDQKTAKTTYTFGGYENLTEVMPDDDLTIEAIWVVDTKGYFTLNVVSEYGKDGYTRDESFIVLEGTDLYEVTTFPTLANYTEDDKKTSKISYKFQGYENYAEVMPKSNLTIKAIWNVDQKFYYTLRVVSQYGKNGYTRNETFTVLEGTELSEITTFPTLESYVVDDGTYTKEVTYTFNGYTNFAITMPTNNLTITANWTVTTKYYRTLTFDLTWSKPIDWSDYNDKFAGKIERLSDPTPVTSIKDSSDKTIRSYQNNIFKVLDGTTIDLTSAVSTCKYKYTAFWASAEYDLKVVTWNETGAKSVARGVKGSEYHADYDLLETITINGSNKTLYTTWGWA